MEQAIDKAVRELEARAGSTKGENAKVLRAVVEETIAQAEAACASPDIFNRLDSLLIALTEASRDVCTNTRCPHYNKKCRMR